MFGEKRSVPVNKSQGHYSIAYGANIGGFMGSDGQFHTSGSYIPAYQALRNSDIWTAVITIASDIARTIFHSDNKSEEKLLQNPSVLTNRFSHYQAMAMQLLLDGNAYALRREGDERKGEWWEFIPPSGVTTWLADNGQALSYDVTFFNPNEEPLHGVEASDMIHLRWASGNGGIIGQSPLISIISEFNLQNVANGLAYSSLKRAITPTSILKSSVKLDIAEREKARKLFEDANTGSNAGRTLVVDPLFEYSQVQINADIAKILASVDYTRSQVAKAFMIPLPLLGEEAEHSNPIQIKAQYDQAFDRYLQAILSEFQSKLSGNITTDIHLINDFDSSGLENRVVALKNAGIISDSISLQILNNSSSDLVTSNLMNLVAKEDLNKTIEGVTNEESGA